MTTPRATYYVSTPIYYVNDRPHIGHLYTTTLADVLARYHRLRGDDVFFLTGTDEHAAKVSDKAAEMGVTAQAWADTNAAIFQETFARLGIENDEFIRTSQERHRVKVTDYVSRMVASGDVYSGKYEGWYDAGQEEYVPENKAKEAEFRSPINGQPLVRREETNFFFRLSEYRQPLLELFEANPTFVQPDARRNEVLGRLREELNDVPISRGGSGGWGIPMPGDPEQTIYVWIDALFNYLTAVDDDQRQHYWPAQVHLIAKDILWFHAVIWPAMLMALDQPLPAQVYSHSFWISEGRKMSKSLGNFIDLEMLDGYVEQFGLDALRWFLATQGPLGSTDSDFAHEKFVDVYNADLANTLGNCANRVTNMISRYCQGSLPTPASEHDDEHTRALRAVADPLLGRLEELYGRSAIGAAANASMDLVRAVDGFIERTRPFTLAKEEDKAAQLGNVLYHCAEALRLASLGLWPVMPGKIEALWSRLGLDYDPAEGRLAQWCRWGALQAGTPIEKGAPLFPRRQD